MKSPAYMAGQIEGVLRGCRFDLTTEAVLQQEIAERLKWAEIPFEREKQLSKQDRIDFLIAGVIGVEVKIKGSPPVIYRQCERYCQHASVKLLILATNRPMYLPQEINGKRCYVINLAKAHL